MNTSASNLGEIKELGKALGFIDNADKFRQDWLSRPSHYLSQVMADETQRNALVDFADSVLGGETRDTDPDGLIWLPVVSHPDPHITVYAVLDPTPADYVGIGVGVRLATTAPESHTQAFVPIFRAAKNGHSVPDPILIGQSADAMIRLGTDITLGSAPPLGGLGLSVSVPTTGGAPPRFALTLKHLLLPGASAPRDFTVSADSLDTLDDAALQLVLGLVRAQADAVGGPVAALVGLLGLGDDAVPNLPLDQLATQGAAALAGWFESVVSSPAGRAAWLDHIATLMGGAAAGDEVTLAVGPAQAAFGVRVAAGTGGHPVVTPSLGFGIASGDLRIRAQADLLRLDLGNGAARALPAFTAFAQFGKRADGGSRLISGDPQVDSVRVGLTLDAQRRPNFLLAADGVILSGHSYPTLDLSTPGAIAEAAGTVVGDVLDSLLAGLGPVADAVKLLLGLTAPLSAPGATRLDIAAFLHDPMAALRTYWHDLLRDHPTAVKDLLTTLRDLLSDTAHTGAAISGTGTDIDPWRLPLAGPVGFDAWIAPSDVLHIAVSAGYAADNLGHRCTRVETRIAAEIVRLDLSAGSAVFLSAVEGRLTARARDAGRARLGAGPFQLTADFIGVRSRWTPSSGLAADVLAPNLAVELEDGSIPVALPVRALDGSLALDAAGWDSLEGFLGLLAHAAPVPWVGQLADALGWNLPGHPRLRLADLAADPRTAIDDAGRIQDGLRALARVLTGSPGSTGHLQGVGSQVDPYRLRLLPAGASPSLCAWTLPDGPSRPVTNAPEELQAWRPGTAGFEPGELAAALAAEGASAPDLADLLSGRSVAEGLALLADRWTGTDGRILPPAAEPAGFTVHRVDGATVAHLADAVDLEDLFDPLPAIVIRIGVRRAGASLPAGLAIDVRAPGLDPASFPLPAAAAGEWFVALAERPDARLTSGDADGLAGQTARLQRVLAPFASLGDNHIVLVAESAAGWAALGAANALAFVGTVITTGTPLGPVAFTVLDDQPAADALRLLRALLPGADEAESDDPVLAQGRGLVNALSDLLPMGDPGREIRPPAVPIVPRAGLDVHAYFGVMPHDAVLAAITAIAAAGLAARAMARAAAPRRPVTEARFGLRLPVAAGETGITVSGFGQLDLVGVNAAGLTTGRRLNVHLEIRRAGAWLVGGPGTGLGAGDRPTEALRWLEANLGIPLDGGDADAEIILHESAVFGIERERWVVGATGASTVSPALPEVRVLLSLVAERLEAPAASAPAVDALLGLLRGLGVLASTGGAVPDAIDHLLHDPAAHVASALADGARRAPIQAALNQLLAGLPRIAIDLAARTFAWNASGTPGPLGMLHWTADVQASAAGTASATLSLGSVGTTAAGGAVLTLETAPTPHLTLARHRPGLSAPELIPLWPVPDKAALERILAHLVPAECLRLTFEYLRSLDDTAKPVIDLALDAIGLLAPAVDSQRSVLLPAGLLQDPAGWFQHESAFGPGFSAPRVVALLDALKPIVGIAGDPGKWRLATGVTVAADAVDGHLRLGLHFDTSAFAPIVTPAGRLISTGTFTLTLPPGGAPQPGLSVALGLAGAAPGRRAVVLEIAPTVRVFVRPETGPDLSIYPDPPGLGQLAGAAVARALPLILDELAGLSGATLQGRVGEVVRAVGDGLNLRVAGHFDSTRLEAWADDPVTSLVNALPTLGALALQAIASALQPVLPAGVAVAAASGTLTVTAGTSVALAWRPSPFQFGCDVTVTGLLQVQRLDAGIVLDTTGLRSLSATLGPAAIDAGGVTLRPHIAAVAGEAPAGGRRVELGLAIDGGTARRVGARWNIDGAGLSLIAVNGASEFSDAEHVALTLLEAVLDLVAGFAIGTAPVQQLLTHPVGAATTVRNVLRGVILEDVGSPANLDANLFDPALLLTRVQRLGANLCGANPSVNVGSGLSIGLSMAGSIAQLTLGVNGRVPLTSGDVVVSVEADSRWIKDQPAAGIALGLLETAGALAFKPSLSANGLGIRISKNSGPLVNAGLSLGSVAIHLFGKVGDGIETAGGVQVQLSDLAVAVSGAQGGNPVARGLTGDSGSGPNGLAPAFSPALAVQKHGSGPVLVSLRAGDGDGPWWLIIQKGFGPIYIEQVGFGVTVREDQLERISILLDGRVSIFGLTAAVDDLSLTYVVASDASLFDPARWSLDLAGLAVNADLAGVTLAGGLRKFGSGDNVEYVGILLARFAVYGLSVFGGYGSAVVDGRRFSSFFAFGAINGPIGGPPAFFLTGIGGGLGINRDLIFPSDMSRFGEFPFLKALDPAARPDPDPMAELARLRDYFPMKRGDFWFAAGISFTSFALVDGIAVVSVKIGDGLEIALLGLARLALPRPQFPLVSIELALLVRFSTKEGVMWIQAQLTDNSWLLHESVRLTGGFAFVVWYKGPNAGQFVLTLGGYHPRFHRDGYPVVPRLGFHWSVSDAIVIKGESYFALTSEALMAGCEVKASAHFGPAWAEVVFGANGIVYFDPFWFEVEVYARISAGVTIDVWIGEITISISLGARIVVSGPKFHGVATFDVGPISLTVEFGDASPPVRVPISWAQFVTKYLEEASPGVARVLTAIPGKGALPPGTKGGGASATGTADGSAEKPFEVYSEFELSLTTTVPTQQFVALGAGPGAPLPSQALGIAPVGTASANTALTVKLIRAADGTDKIGALRRNLTTGGFPVGVWGKPQDPSDKKVPAGDIITAMDGVRLEAVASLVGTLPSPVRYFQVETGKRKPLPFVTAQAERANFVARANALKGVLPAAATVSAMYAVANSWLARGGSSRTAIAALERERSAPPRLGSLGEGLASAELPKPNVTLTDPAVAPPVDARVLPPRAIAVLAAPVLPEVDKLRTTVTAADVPRIAAPTLASVQAAGLAIPARLVRLPAAAAASTQTRTAIVTGAVPLTRMARGASAAVAMRGADADGTARLNAMTGALAGAGVNRQPDSAATTLRAGELAVLQLPNAIRDVDPHARRPRLVTTGAARVVALGHGGEVLADLPGTPDGIDVRQGVERLLVLATGAASAPGLAGWHSGQELAYTGWSSAIGAGCMVKAEGALVRTTRQRFRAGWALGAELVTGTTIVTTRFAQAARTVVIVLDDPTGSEAARGLRMTLDGADRRPVQPTVVATGNRSVLLYTIAGQGPFSVAVGSQDGWHLAGVMAGNDAPETLARRFAENGLDQIVQPLVAGRTGTVTIGWADPNPAVPPSRGHAIKRAAVKKAAPKKVTPQKAAAKKTATRAAATKVARSKNAAKAKRKPKRADRRTAAKRKR